MSTSSSAKAGAIWHIPQVCVKQFCRQQAIQDALFHSCCLLPPGPCQLCLVSLQLYWVSTDSPWRLGCWRKSQQLILTLGLLWNWTCSFLLFIHLGTAWLFAGQHLPAHDVPQVCPYASAVQAAISAALLVLVPHGSLLGHLQGLTGYPHLYWGYQPCHAWHGHWYLHCPRLLVLVFLCKRRAKESPLWLSSALSPVNTSVSDDMGSRKMKSCLQILPAGTLRLDNRNTKAASGNESPMA